MELVSALVEGDQAALGHLYDRYAGVVYATACRLLGDPGSAEDVVQETMLALWDRAELYDPDVASLGSWLATISRNRAIDRLRARKRRIPALPLSSVAAGDDGNAEAWDRVLQSGTLLAAAQKQQEPSVATEAAWLRDTLGRAVASLPLVERQVIELAYAGDLTQAEIASRLGWPIGTVKTRTRRALASLHATLAEPLGPQGRRQIESVMQPARSLSGAERPDDGAREPLVPGRVCA
jgi:RNA polymerase sigma-70 factor (ECF subfamily)